MKKLYISNVCEILNFYNLKCLRLIKIYLDTFESEQNYNIWLHLNNRSIVNHTTLEEILKKTNSKFNTHYTIDNAINELYLLNRIKQ